MRGSSSGAKPIAARQKAPANIKASKPLANIKASKLAKRKASKPIGRPTKPRPRTTAARTHADTGATSPPPPPVLRMWLETKARMQEHLAHRVDVEHIERAARVLLEGDSGREADPIVVDAVATILERIADQACALEFGASGGQRVAAAEALEGVQELLVKLAEPWRAEFVELVADYAQRLQAASTDAESRDGQAIAGAFIMSATRFDRAFRRLDEAEVLRALRQLRKQRGAKAPGASAVAGALSAKVGAFNERLPKRAANAFDKAWKAWQAERTGKRSRAR